MPEYHSPEEERVMRRVNTQLLCAVLNVSIGLQDIAGKMATAGAALGKLKDTYDFNEIRRLDPPIDT